MSVVLHDDIEMYVKFANRVHTCRGKCCEADVPNCYPDSLLQYSIGTMFPHVRKHEEDIQNPKKNSLCTASQKIVQSKCLFNVYCCWILYLFLTCNFLKHSAVDYRASLHGGKMGALLHLAQATNDQDCTRQCTYL